jgi:hypothetical protein
MNRIDPARLTALICLTAITCVFVFQLMNDNSKRDKAVFEWVRKQADEAIKAYHLRYRAIEQSASSE